MRLLFVHERFGAMGGAEVNALLTAAELRRRGHTVGLVHGSETGKGEGAWREVFSDRFPLNNGNGFESLMAGINQFQPDALYVHKMSDLAVIKGLVHSGRPVVRMVHDHDLYCMRSYKYHPLTRKICARPASLYCVFPCAAVITRNQKNGFPLRWVSYRQKKNEIHLNRHFQRMVVASDYMKQELLRNGFEPAHIEVHAPVPAADASGVQSSFSDRNLIVYAGQVIRGKGVDVLLQSLSKLNLEFECLVLGEGSHKSYCQTLARQLGLQSRVTFKGYVPPEEMRNWYSEASVAVMSSVWPEPFGAVGLEAMRYGLPVVAFDAGGIKEWLIDGSNGFLVPHMDRAQFALRLETLLRDKTLAREMGARGRRLLQQKYNFEQYITGLEDMFGRVVAEHRNAKITDRIPL